MSWCSDSMFVSNFGQKRLVFVMLGTCVIVGMYSLVRHLKLLQNIYMKEINQPVKVCQTHPQQAATCPALLAFSVFFCFWLLYYVTQQNNR